MSMSLEKYFIDFEFDQMSRYLDMVEQSIAQEFEKMVREHEKEMEELTNGEVDDDYVDFVVSKYEERFVEIGKDFPKLIYGSFIVAWYSFVEQKMLDICETSGLKISVSAKDNVSLGKGIEKAKKFF